MDESGPIIDGIYEAAILPDLWPRVLDAIATHVGGFGGLLFTSGRHGDGWTCSEPVRDTFGRLVAEGWLARNSRLPRQAERGMIHRVATDLDLFTADEMAVDPLYRTLRRANWGWFAGTTVDVPGGNRLAFSFERAFSEGPYGREAAARLAVLRPHLARASLLAARIGLDRHATAAETLGRLGLPAAVLGGGGRLLASNALFEAAMPAAVLAGRERIRLADPVADRGLVAALASLEGGRTGTAPLSLAMKAQTGAPARLLHLLPVRSAAQDIFTGAAWLAVMTPLGDRRPPDTAVLGRLFGLSPREAELALALAAGNTLAGHAGRSGISASTARSQLKRVFEKTGVRRQAELVGLLARLSGP